MKKERHKIVAAVYAIIIKNGKILLSLKKIQVLWMAGIA